MINLTVSQKSKVKDSKSQLIKLVGNSELSNNLGTFERKVTYYLFIAKTSLSVKDKVEISLDDYDVVYRDYQFQDDKGKILNRTLKFLYPKW